MMVRYICVCMDVWVCVWVCVCVVVCLGLFLCLLILTWFNWLVASSFFFAFAFCCSCCCWLAIDFFIIYFFLFIFLFDKTFSLISQRALALLSPSSVHPSHRIHVSDVHSCHSHSKSLTSPGSSWRCVRCGCTYSMRHLLALCRAR